MISSIGIVFLVVRNLHTLEMCNFRFCFSLLLILIFREICDHA